MEYLTPVFLQLYRIHIYLQEMFYSWWCHLIWYLFVKHSNCFHQLIFNLISIFLYLLVLKLIPRKLCSFPLYTVNFPKISLYCINDLCENLWEFMPGFIVFFIESDDALCDIYRFFATYISYVLILNPLLTSIFVNTSYHRNGDSIQP